MPSEACCFGGDALHQATVPCQRIGHMIDDRMLRLVVACSQEALRQSHAHRGREPAAQGTRGDLHAWGVVELWVAWRLGPKLAKVLEVLE